MGSSSIELFCFLLLSVSILLVALPLFLSVLLGYMVFRFIFWLLCFLGLLGYKVFPFISWILNLLLYFLWSEPNLFTYTALALLGGYVAFRFFAQRKKKGLPRPPMGGPVMDFTKFYDFISSEINNFEKRFKVSSELKLSTLLAWGLFSPLEPQFDAKFNSPIAIRYEDKLKGVIRFSLLQSLLGIEGRIIEPPEYQQLFNSLISAMYSSFLSYSKEFGLDKDEPNACSSCIKILAQAQQKAYSLFVPDEIHSFIRHWAPRFTTESFLSSLGFSEYPSMLRISYSSNIEGFWKIASYSPLRAMETTSGSPIADKRLHRALSYQLLRCIFQVGHVVNVCPHWIDVCLHMDNVRCDVCPLDPAYLESINAISDFPNERHFPAKICLKIGPENGCGVHSVSLTGGKEKAYGATFEPPKNVDLKASAATTSTVKINNWGFEQSVENCSDAKIDCTLYDTTTGEAVFNNGPPQFSVLSPKTWSIDRYSKACRAFAEEGGVAFAKDNYGNSITWRLNRDLEGRTLKWIVKGSVWLTYWPNTYLTRYSETKRHDFRQELDLTLVDTSASM